MPEEITPLGETVIPFVEETIAPSKRKVETRRVCVALSTDVEQVVVRKPCWVPALTSHAWRGIGCLLRASRCPRPARKVTPSSLQWRGNGGCVKRLVLREEVRLRVGKRETNHGRIRIRSYVVETPVRQQVTLREERVQVECRPADRPVGAAADAAFAERIIEASETFEEAVVSKEARVREEVVVRKTAEDRTGIVQDTVRRTEVEVDDDRDRANSAGPCTARPDDV